MPWKRAVLAAPVCSSSHSTGQLLYDQVSVCVWKNRCDESLMYVAEAAGQTRGTIHRGVTLVEEGCRLHSGAGQCGEGGRVRCVCVCVCVCVCLCVCACVCVGRRGGGVQAPQQVSVGRELSERCGGRRGGRGGGAGCEGMCGEGAEGRFWGRCEGRRGVPVARKRQYVWDGEVCGGEEW